MGKCVVLAEKPSVGRDIARVLGCKQGGNGYFEGGNYIVTWALGHLVTLADPEAYGEGNKNWSLENLPIMPEKMELVVIKQTNRQYQKVKEQLRRKDVSEIIIATDAGREGELVARWIIAKAGVHKPIKRLWISSVTDGAIKDGFKRLEDGRKYDSLYQSAAARAEADWYVGINATRALTCKFNAQLSCGRVQTPTLAIINSREQEIKNFVSQPYWMVRAEVPGMQLEWHDVKTGNTRLNDEKKAEVLKKKLNGAAAKITKLTHNLKKVYAPLLYDLTELQRDANKKYGFSAKETLSIMQKLYETHKVLTYPRTDSRYLTQDIVPTLKERLKACGTGPYSKLAFQAGKQLQPSRHFVDDNKVSDHHAIIPTEQFVDLRSFSEKERKIYDLVVRRFIAVLYPPYEYEQIALEAVAGGELLKAAGRLVKKLGWREAYQQNDIDSDADNSEELTEQKLPELVAGDELKISRVNVIRSQTKPPKAFNEAGLLSAMENPAKYMTEQNKQLKESLAMAGGIGTVATRADIIEKLYANFLIEKRNNEIFMTTKGRQLLDLVPAELKQPELTAKWEQQLNGIAKGSLNKQSFIQDIKLYAGKLVGIIKDSQEKFRYDNVTRKKCPECGKFLLEVNGKRGKMLVCQDRECGYRHKLSMVTNARCPECHKKMELKGEGDGKYFACGCGYREKLSVFQKRKESSAKGKVSKRDVAKFMNQQDKEPVNTALADALAKLGLK